MNELNPHYNTHSSSPGEQPISTASNSDQVQSPLNAQDKGKGKKVIVDTSESDWNESSDEEENQVCSPLFKGLARIDPE